MTEQDIVIDEDFNILEICCACLSKNPTHWVRGKTAEAYTNMTGQKLSKDLPNHMCESCDKLLKQSDDFRSKCIESYKWLIKARNMINKKIKEKEVKQEIEIDIDNQNSDDETIDNIDSDNNLKEVHIEIDPLHIIKIETEDLAEDDDIGKKSEELSLLEFKKLIDRQKHSQEKLSDLDELNIKQKPHTISSNNESENVSGNQVIKLCEATPQGKALLKACERATQTGSIDTKLRSQLCTHLISQLTPLELNVKLPDNAKLQQLSQDIACLFSTENAELYFTPSISKSKFSPRKNTCGWLVNARNNRKKALINLGLLEQPAKKAKTNSMEETKILLQQSVSGNTEIDLSHLEDVDSNDVQTAIKCLQRFNINTAPWEVIEELWSKAVKTRLYSCYENNNLEEYLHTYSFLKRPEGWKLLIKDFEALYPTAANGLANCKKLISKIFSYSQNKIKFAKNKFVVATIKTVLDQCLNNDDENIKITGAIILISCLYKISPVASRKGGTGDRSEVLKSFITFVSSENNVTATIQEHFSDHGTFQPLFVVIGQPYNVIETVFFFLTGTTFWTFKTFPEALDAGFKVLHAVGYSYPTSCYSTWLAVQIAFYRIKTDYDDCSRSLKQLLLDLGLASTLQPYLAVK